MRLSLKAFRECQLFPSLFGLSPLPQTHPCVFHHTRVRSSTQFYLSFNLAMVRSLGFGSTTCYSFRPCQTRFPSAPALLSLNLATYRNSQAHSTKGTPSHPFPDALTCCGLMVSGSISLPSPGFFSPFPHGPSSLSVAATYLALDRGRPCFRQGFSGLAVLRFPSHGGASWFRLRGSHPLWPAFPCRSSTTAFSQLRGLPHVALNGTCYPRSTTACALTWI